MTHRAQVRLIRRVLAACAVTLGMLTTVAPAAVAAAAAAAPPLGWLRLANLSPGTPTFDIYLYSVDNVHARLVLRNIGYGTVSGYEALPACGRVFMGAGGLCSAGCGSGRPYEPCQHGASHESKGRCCTSLLHQDQNGRSKDWTQPLTWERPYGIEPTFSSPWTARRSSSRCTRPD